MQHRATVAQRSNPLLLPLPEHCDLDLSKAVHSDRTGAGGCEVNDPTSHERPAVIDPHDHRSPIALVGDPHAAPERQRPVRGRQRVRVSLLTARRTAGPVGVDGGDAGLRGGLDDARGKERESREKARWMIGKPHGPPRCARTIRAARVTAGASCLFLQARRLLISMGPIASEMTFLRIAKSR